MTAGPAAGALFTDVYELAMAAVYAAEGMSERAAFEVSFRMLPPERSHVVFAGLDEVLGYLEGFRFEADEIRYLAELRPWPPSFLERLRGLRFGGDVWAVPEGSIVFPHEPLLRVEAPILEAQLFETFVLNQLHVHSVLATKASRVVAAAEGRAVVDFGARRSQGVDAALALAKTSWIAGAAGTSNVLAGRRYGVPVFGTMAHSYVQAFGDERAAFEAFVRHNPGTTLLIDTYDTLRGVEHVIALARRLGPAFDVGGVRLDSGDLAGLARAVRGRLDAAGLERVRIFASSGLDEHAIARLVRNAAPIDGFGVGSALAVSADAPGLDLVYKLVEYGGVGRTKLSSEKVLYPGRKQVFRELEDGKLARDTIGSADERLLGTPLLERVMANGRRLSRYDLAHVRRHAERERRALPDALAALESGAARHPVAISRALVQALDDLRRRR